MLTNDLESHTSVAVDLYDNAHTVRSMGRAMVELLGATGDGWFRVVHLAVLKTMRCIRHCRVPYNRTLNHKRRRG